MNIVSLYVLSRLIETSDFCNLTDLLQIKKTRHCFRQEVHSVKKSLVRKF